MSQENRNRLPRRSILKNSDSSVRHQRRPDDQSSSDHSRATQFDELNIKETLHPSNKDYGHMKVGEPETPYHDGKKPLPFDPGQLLLEAGPSRTRRSVSENAEEAVKEEQEEFEKRRRSHYNEYQAILIARKLFEVEKDEDEDAHDDSTDSEEELDSESEGPSREKHTEKSRGSSANARKGSRK